MYKCLCKKQVKEVYLLDHNNISKASPSYGRWLCKVCIIHFKGYGMYVKRNRLKKHPFALDLVPFYEGCIEV
jgi:hypothetical protein